MQHTYVLTLAQFRLENGLSGCLFVVFPAAVAVSAQLAAVDTATVCDGHGSHFVAAAVELADDDHVVESSRFDSHRAVRHDYQSDVVAASVLHAVA